MKLNDNQRTLLMAIGLGCVVHYRDDTFRYWRPSYPLSDVAPSNIEGATMTGRALQRLGVIFPYDRENARAGYGKARLTQAGIALFEAALTPAHREALAEQARRDEMAEQARTKAAHRAAWERENEEVLRARRERNHDRAFERHSLQVRLTQIAQSIANGANDVDPLIDEMRTIGARQRAIEVEQASDDAAAPIYPGDERNET